MNKILVTLSLILLLISCEKSNLLEVSSPDDTTKIKIDLQEGKLYYTLINNGEELIRNSELSIVQNVNVNVTDSKVKQVNQSWEPVWGQFSEIIDHHNELTINLSYGGVPAELLIRTYDNGAAFRFKMDEKPENINPSFFIEYDLDKRCKVYAPAGEKQPFGPIDIAAMDSLEAGKRSFKMPLLIDNDEGKYLSLLESDLYSAPGFDLIKFNYDKERRKLFSKSEYSGNHEIVMSPWKIILVEDKIGDLLTNTIPLNVAAPNEISDPSWIRPGKTLWDWRVHGYTADDGFTYGIDNESYYRFIDFAAKKKIEYFLIDDAWYSDVGPGKITMSEKLDLDAVRKYADEKGVSLLLYYDRRHGNYGDEALFPYYQSLGMDGIKYGFMGENVDFTREAIRMSAESKLHIDFHDGPVPFTGISRTYPNAVTREYCHAQQDSRRAFTPKTFIRMALINAIQGPLDMNNGIFDITGVNAGQREKGPRQLNSLFTTVTAEAARTLIIFSGLVCIPDAPEAYEAKADLFKFIEKMPVGKWDESIVLHAKMDEYISTARRHGDEWFIGSVHNEGGSLDISLDFLEEGKNYKITYYEDTAETDSKSKPEAYQVRHSTVKKGGVIQAKMAAGGGHCIWIRPE